MNSPLMSVAGFSARVTASVLSLKLAASGQAEATKGHRSLSEQGILGKRQKERVELREYVFSEYFYYIQDLAVAARPLDCGHHLRL